MKTIKRLALTAMRTTTKVFSVSAVAFSLAAGAHAEDAHVQILDALQHPDRPSQDLRLDHVRKPAEVLNFFGVRPGMKVLDVFAGPGYYTEILNHLVGDDGEVTMFNHKPWEAYSKAGSDARVKDNRLQNVKTMFEDINTVEFSSNHYDASLIILGLHDLYHKSEKSVSGDELDTAYFLKALYKGMKPGGVVGVIEHEAKAGGDHYKVVDDLERLNSDEVKRIMKNAGFVLEAQSNILRNNFDDLTKGAFDPSIRRKTDRAVMRFRKPE